jgi:hypothetical protein
LLTSFTIVNILLGNPGDLEILMQQCFLLGSSGVFGSYLRTQGGPFWCLEPAEETEAPAVRPVPETNVTKKWHLQLYTWHFVAFSLLAIMRMNFF